MNVIYEPKGRAKEYADLAVNLYSGCSHGCIYCFAPRTMHKERSVFHGEPKPRKNVLVDLMDDCQRLTGSVTPPILMSFASDPYQPLEVEMGLTSQALQILRIRDLSWTILTKGGMRAMPDFSLYRKGDTFGTTLTFLSTEQSRIWEPGAALPDDRIEAIKVAHSLGIRTWVSLEPVIDLVETLEIIDATKDIVDFYTVGPLNYHEKAKNMNWPLIGRILRDRLVDYGKPFVFKKDLRCKVLDGVTGVSYDPERGRKWA